MSNALAILTSALVLVATSQPSSSREARRDVRRHHRQAALTALVVVAAVPALAFVVVLQLAVTLPVVGGLIGLIATLIGVGALVARGWSRRNRARLAAIPIPLGA